MTDNPQHFKHSREHQPMEIRSSQHRSTIKRWSIAIAAAGLAVVTVAGGLALRDQNPQNNKVIPYSVPQESRYTDQASQLSTTLKASIRKDLSMSAEHYLAKMLPQRSNRWDQTSRLLGWIRRAPFTSSPRILTRRNRLDRQVLS